MHQVVRSVSFQNVPTLAEHGYPSLTVSSWFGIFAPARTPPEIVSRMNEIFIRAMRTQSVKDKLQNLLLDGRGIDAGAVRFRRQRGLPALGAGNRGVGIQRGKPVD